MIRKTATLMCALVGALAVLSALQGFASADEPGFVAEWSVKPEFDGKKKLRKSISGAACAPVAPPVCVVALDEKQRTQFFTLDGNRIIPGKSMRLLPKELNGAKTGEIDAEGAAYGDGFFYIVGSHGLSRKKAEFNSSSFFLFRFPVDGETGVPEFKFSKKTVAPVIERTDELRAILKGAPDPIGHYAEKPLGEGDGGVNIEGLAYRDGRLYIGLRGPSVDGRAFLRSVNVDALFSNSKPDLDVIELALGSGAGVRDLAAVSDGLIVLSGPVQSKGDYALHHLRFPSLTLSTLADLKMPDRDHKAETVLVLSENRDSFDLLVMYDGAVDGGPREYHLLR
ncbi:DUF3616 domain-containing protein [Roseibium alexandrii]|uniref:DUF3616 domain-containing protein n=1 Tax=Roseibium alexandrii (strain DSM 17067 / NCIMB 14079 / DFL-11) TaxID=244592 RepID=A0A5E8H4A3_ROSAD|nr:DUF3616 domain-containing protein [Roseibium alexandrii]EEE47325.1 Protein of unknown function (DUF3616) [Roseibium alexandrii DFL-11]